MPPTPGHQGCRTDAKAQALARLAVLIAVAPITGLAPMVTATPAVACSIGYDLDRAFELLDGDPCDCTR
jgi:hypothetical protein